MTRPNTSTSPAAPSEARDARLEAIWARAYKARTRDDLRTLYRDWAATYDSDHRHVGFFGHRLTAQVLARHLTRRDAARVLDAGAGTGAAGEALAALGFSDLVAVDLSEDMLARARAKGVYTQTIVADLSLPVDAFGDDSFDAAILVGVFSYGQAPAEALDEVVRLVRPGGAVAFTLRCDFHAENAMGIRSRMEHLERRGAWRLVECTDPAPYLPGRDSGAMFQVWCYRVTGRKPAEFEDGFEAAVREALEGDDWVKKIDHAWIWDSTASRLYNRYTQTPGYYLTDAEEAILRDAAADIVGPSRLLVELGCGSARKVSHLLDAATAGGAAVRYVPIDVSPGALRATESAVVRQFGSRVVVEARQGLFDDILPGLPIDQPKVVLFFGSSIGNIDTIDETIHFLGRLRDRLTPDDRLVVGVDLHKDIETLAAAYNTEEACRSFFVHMIRRINDYLGADFDPRVFQLSSTYDEERTSAPFRSWRMNLRIAPTEPQHTWVRRLDLEVHLEPGQPVQVGISRKFRPEDIGGLAALAGLRLTRQWLDPQAWFSLNELRRA
ncbi:MAG TPA: L-histidine N(alpha)-methyltransferase [Vicinamibacterales bacterium]|nr:L-histidine N(alpha)-methyltransferase [Vicinamibacterales bacterium]